MEDQWNYNSKSVLAVDLTWAYVLYISTYIRVGVSEVKIKMHFQRLFTFINILIRKEN